MPRRRPRSPLSNLGDLRRSDACFFEQSVRPRDSLRGSHHARAAVIEERQKASSPMPRPARADAEQAHFERVLPTHAGNAQTPYGPGVLPAPRRVTTTPGSCNREWRFYADFTTGEFHCIRIQWEGGPRDVSYEVERRIVNAHGLELGFQKMPPDDGTATIDIWLPGLEEFQTLVYRVRATDGRGFSPWTTHVFHKPSWHRNRRDRSLAFQSVVEGRKPGKTLTLAPLHLPFVPPTADEADGIRRLIAGHGVSPSREAVDRLVLAAA